MCCWAALNSHSEDEDAYVNSEDLTPDTTECSQEKQDKQDSKQEHAKSLQSMQMSLPAIFVDCFLCLKWQEAASFGPSPSQLHLQSNF